MQRESKPRPLRAYRYVRQACGKAMDAVRIVADARAGAGAADAGSPEQVSSAVRVLAVKERHGGRDPGPLVGSA